MTERILGPVKIQKETIVIKKLNTNETPEQELKRLCQKEGEYLIVFKCPSFKRIGSSGLSVIIHDPIRAV